MRRPRLDGVLRISRLSAVVGVAVAYTPARGHSGVRALLTQNNGATWHVVQGGWNWRLFEGDERMLYVAPAHEYGPPWHLYRLERWPSTRPRYVRVYTAAGSIESLQPAPGGVVALVAKSLGRYAVAVHRNGRTRTYRIPGGYEANPPSCEAREFSVRWPVIAVIKTGGAKCEQFSVGYESRDGGRTWRYDPDLALP